VFNAGDVLPASDLNTNMLQPHTAGTGTRVVAGKTAFTITTAISGTASISYGVTFTALTSLVGTVQSASNIDLVLTWSGAPTTSGATARLAEKSGSSVTVSGNVHWIAVGTP
jgi:hypothetical protein